MGTPHLKRVLSLRDVVLFNVVVIFSVRGMTTAAKIGPLSVLLWLLAVAAFFLPLGLAVAELGTRDPGEGGFYRWTRDAFGEVHGFLGAWYYWVSNLTYLPSLLIFLTGAVAFTVGKSSLGENRWFMLSLSLGVLWLTAWVNVRGLSLGKIVNNVGAYTSWMAAVLLIVAGAVTFARYGSATQWSWHAVTGSIVDIRTLAYFGTLSFALVGLELAPVMGEEITDPVRTLPKALLISGVAIAALYIVGTLAIMVSLPPDLVSPISGAMGAVQEMARRAGWLGLSPFVALLISISVLGGLSAWLGGVARLPYAVGLDRFLPAAMSRLHPRHGTPAFAIIFQTVLISVFILASQAGATVREAYLILLDMTIVLNFIPFIYIFLALPRLRPKGKEPGVVRVPGGRGVLSVVALAGLGATLLTLVTAVIPPSDVTNPWLFEAKLWGGLVVLSFVGYRLYAQFRAAQ
ncbi:MAG: APC family permease [Gemmatimonadales bacterium]